MLPRPMQLDIERGALFAIRETTTLSLRLVPWHPWWRTDDVDPKAVLYGGVKPLAAVCDPPSGGHSPTKTAASDSTAQRGASTADWVGSARAFAETE